MRRRSNSTGGRFLDPADVDRALEDVADAIAEDQVSAALAGGVAMQLYGSGRFTQDVDVIADAELSAIEYQEPLSFGGYEGVGPSGAAVDVIIREDDYAPLYQEALREAQHHEDLPIPVVTREYLAAMKLAADRNKDREDLAHLVLHTPLDISRTREIIVEFLGLYAGREFDAFVEEVRALGRAP